MIASQIGQLIADQRYIAVQNDLLSGRLPDLGHLQSVIDTLHTVYALNLMVVALTAILFIVWFFHAYRNLGRAGIGGLRYTPGWAIGAWFIPFLNLVRPKRIANDLWKETESAASVGPESRQGLRLPASINWWWGLWILGDLLGAIATGRSPMPTPTRSSPSPS